MFFKNTIDHKSDYKHIGDIEFIEVLHKDNIYLLLSKDIGVGYFNVIVDKSDNKKCLIEVAFLDKSFRGKDIFEKFILFLKIHEKFSKIVIGDVHSANMISTIKKLSKNLRLLGLKIIKLKYMTHLRLMNIIQNSNKLGGLLCLKIQDLLKIGRCFLMKVLLILDNIMIGYWSEIK